MVQRNRILINLGSNVIFFVCFMICGCDTLKENNEMSLELKYIGRFEKKVLTKNNQEFLKISGLCMHSSYAVKQMTSNRENANLYVHILVIPAYLNKDMRGDFAFELPINGINKVFLGDNNDLIWCREVIK